MLKVGGWVITEDAASAWFDKHADTDKFDPEHFGIHTCSHVIAFWDYRGKIGAPLPFSREQATSFTIPKTTPQKFGESICFIVARLYRTSTETWKIYQDLEIRDKDRLLFETLQKDGLALGEWITVADPWEDDWPFAKRHPGRRPPPDLAVQATEERLRKAQMGTAARETSLDTVAYKPC